MEEGGEILFLMGRVALEDGPIRILNTWSLNTDTYFGSIFLRYLENTWQAKVFFATYFLQPSNNMGHNMFLLGKKGVVLGVEKDLSKPCKIPF